MQFQILILNSDLSTQLIIHMEKKSLQLQHAKGHYFYIVWTLIWILDVKPYISYSQYKFKISSFTPQMAWVSKLGLVMNHTYVICIEVVTF